MICAEARYVDNIELFLVDDVESDEARNRARTENRRVKLERLDPLAKYSLAILKGDEVSVCNAITGQSVAYLVKGTLNSRQHSFEFYVQHVLDKRKSSSNIHWSKKPRGG